ncbi:hypothetical protein AB0C07_35400 [Actinoplanes missouriensis]|uniref:hypothetical protein n=1 Tax=Actinoplanes missouriensis TaxID=1866 RepID=UPI0033D60A73
MTYDLLLVGNLDPSRLRAVLATVASVPGEDVDVAGPDTENRNWDAPVLCTYEPVVGDVNWSLDLYLTRSEPSMHDVANHIAGGLGVLVLYPAQAAPPGAFWLVEPDGSRVRARVEDYDRGDVTALVVEAVEKPVAVLPHAKVELQPEVIREHRMATPVTDEFDALLAAHSQELVAGDPLWFGRNRLKAWEAVTMRMAFGWPPDGWYPLEYWQEDLAMRDTLDADAGQIPPDFAGAFAAALARVDDTFRAATQEIPGVSADKAWWWHRAPEPPPWLNR